MEQIMILSGNDNAGAALAGFLRESFRCTPKVLPSGYQARTALENDRHTELVLINAPLLDESGVELAKYVTQETLANCILMLKAEQAEKLSDFPERHQVIVLGRPLNKPMLYQLIQTLDIAIRRAKRLAEENQRLEQKVRDIRTVDRAKFLMMQYEGMTEAEAHAYLEKYAMDKRKRKPIAAMEIIDRINEQYL